MCKKLVLLISLVLAGGFWSKVSAAIEYTYNINVINVGTAYQLAGSTDGGYIPPTGFDPQYWPDHSILGTWGTCTYGLGWAKWDIPDFGAMGQIIIMVELQLTVEAYGAPRPWAGIKATRVDDTSWDLSTINHNWPISGDVVVLLETQAADPDGPNGWSWWPPVTTITDITHWWTGCPQSLTGAEQFSVQINQVAPYDTDIMRQKMRYLNTDLMLHITTKGRADLNEDWIVDFKDYAILASQWQQVPSVPSADILPDGIVDVNDLVLLVHDWLWTEPAPCQATDPNPMHLTKYVEPNVHLSWSLVSRARLYDVYFGTDYNDVNSANELSNEYVGNQDFNSWDPCGLDVDTVYYWRIDTKNVGGVTKGDVWRFKTRVEPSLHGWWKFDEGQGSDANDSVGNNHGTLIGPPGWVDGQVGDYALDFDGDDYVSIPDIPYWDFGPNDFSITAWIKLSPAELGNYGGIISRWEYSTGDRRRWMVLKYNDDSVGLYVSNDGVNTSAAVATAASSVTSGVWYHIAALRHDNTLRIYLNGQEKDSTSFTGAISSDDLGIVIGRNQPLGSTHYFSGTIDDVRIYNYALSADEIWELYNIGRAYDPNPVNGATNLNPYLVVLSWSPGKGATSHDIYFGTDYNDVNDATPASLEYMDNQEPNTWDCNNYDSNGLEYDTTYYWRIDENSPPNTVKGAIWSFSTINEPNFNLVGWWEFEEGYGDTTADSSGNGNDGILSNALHGPPTWVAGKIGSYALDFDGTGNYVDCGNDSSLCVGYLGHSFFTLAAWIKTSATNDAGAYIVGHYKNYYPSSCVNISVDGSHHARAEIRDDGNTATVIGTTNVEDGNWHHVVGVRNGDSLYLYVDGVLEGTPSDASAIWEVGCGLAPWSIGSASTTSAYFEGTVDDVRIYNRSLFAEEIQQLYQVGLD